MTLNFEVPAALSNPLIYERIGAVIKERASGQIVGHIQELGGWNLLSRLPIPGGNVLGMATETIQIAQLQKIQQTLDTVQTLATVGAVASVASLGVSIAGFAAVLAKLKRMEGKLDQVLSETAQVRRLAENLHIKVDALPMAALRARLESVSMARLYEESRRRDSLRDSIEKLSELRHYYGALLASQQFCALGTQNLLALLDTQERLVAACEGELFAEFILSGDPYVISERWRNQSEIFNAIAWKTPLSLYQLAEQGDRENGVYLVTSAEERRSKVANLTDIRAESVARLGSMPSLAVFLQEHNITGLEYMKLLEAQGQKDNPIVVIDAR